ncbi:MAG: phage tail length tape measure family protein, partial [Phycisphaerales bacterium]|nr:phage tail length tape measure family protein [Phycisphaerales bacterium]
MSATTVSIRLGVEGKAEVKRAFDEIGQTGQAALGTVEKALDRAGAATDREVARLKRLAETARLAGEADAAQRRYNAVLGVDRAAAPKSARDSAGVFEEAAREAADFEARAKALRAQIDPLGAAQARLNTELAEYAGLANRGAITTAEHAAVQALARQRFDATEKAIKGVGGATSLTRNQLLTLQYTFNDVVASLASGGSPMTILLQQGGQVTQAFGGLRGTIATLGSSIGVVGGVIAGVAVVVAGLTAAWVANDTSTRAVATALAGVGRSSGATAGELERVAQTSAEAGRVSVAAAREMQVAFLRTGKIGAEEMGRAITLARNYAVTVGVETKAGADELAKALADPARGADELNARLSFLDDRTRQYVRTLAEQNNRSEAQRVILAALVPALADAEAATNAFGRAWNNGARQASNAYDAV